MILLLKKRSNKPEIGHAKKANTEPKRFLREIRGVNTNDYTLGQVIDASIFEAGEIVDVTGISKGKGFKVLSNVIINLVDLWDTVLNTIVELVL